MVKLAINGGPKVRERPFPEWPFYDEREIKALEEVVRSRNWGGFPSPNTRATEFAAGFAAYHDAKYGICAANGTVTLEIALRAGGIKAGDEVIVPPYTWVGTAEAVAFVNAVPVFVDVDPDTYCLDAGKIEEAITDKTSAIIPVHLAMCIADMDRIMELADNRGLLVVEDCAHMHGGKWNGRGVGSIGHFGSFSFQSTKLMTSGEGGIVLTSNKEYEEKCQSLVNCGRKETGYNTYEGRVMGWNYRMTEFQAAVLSVQLERLEEQTRLREENAAYLSNRLNEIQGIKPLKRDKRVTTQASYQYVFRFNPDGFKGLNRDRFVDALNAEGVPCDGYFYIPVYQNALFHLKANEYPECRSRYGDVIDPSSISCPVAERAIYNEAVWMHHPILLGDKKDMDDIVEAVIKIKENVNEIL